MTWFGPRTGLTVAKALRPFEKRKTRQNDEVQAQGEERKQKGDQNFYIILAMDVALRSGPTELVGGRVVRLPYGIQSDKWRWKRSAVSPPGSRQSPQTLWKTQDSATWRRASSRWRKRAVSQPKVLHRTCHGEAAICHSIRQVKVKEICSLSPWL